MFISSPHWRCSISRPDLYHGHVSPHPPLHLPLPLLIQIQLVLGVINLLSKLCQDGPQSAGRVVMVQVFRQTLELRINQNEIGKRTESYRAKRGIL